MSQPLAPRPSEGPPSPGLSTSVQRARKISSACLACKQRKTKCSGGAPCEACAQRNTSCIYDASSDQRRKIASQRTIQNLAQTQDNLERHQQLLGGIIAMLRVATYNETEDLLRLIRSGVDMSQLAAHVRNTLRMSPQAQEEFNTIDFLIDGPRELPSPSQLLNEMSVRNPAADEAVAPDLFNTARINRTSSSGGDTNENGSMGEGAPGHRRSFQWPPSLS